ncbi:MAG: ribulose-phosphate 3-epimerase [Candidatus Omnitrophica bacterium]|nr:ribulose-phosphate 3-epimerase [Candidatus Omnitrophota bacterium]MBU4487638.1 ribulose-phosphate 3-epimerase [Candidatus Omnitrophota bacterium]MCG2705029.1 ribulose-phosphate 3-epimerase [Candidatus Omnitrophota bacterium]
MKRKILVAPSILAADFSSLKTEIEKIEHAGADMIHIDVMDGHFVPNITIGPLIVRDTRKLTKLPLDVHLMIQEPEKYIDEFRKAGSDIITIHAESKGDIKALLERIRSFGLKAGVSLRPKNKLDLIKDYLNDADMVLMMTVEPGFGGQKFMKEVLPKIRKLRTLYSKDIEVDGGINKETAKDAIDAGANVLVAGTFVFESKDVKQAIKDLRGGK